MHISALLREYIAQVLKSLNIEVALEQIKLEHPGDLSHGDYSTNIALILAKDQKMSPKVLAEKIMASMKVLPAHVEDVTVAGPGFINFYLKNSFFAESIHNILQDKDYGKNNQLAGKKIMIEYTQPNPFKPFHIGHLMSNAIGESISRLVEYSGTTPIRTNYQGDVGLHVAKAIWGLRQKGMPEKSLGVKEQAVYIGQCYVDGSTAYETEGSPAKAEIDAINKLVYQKTDPAINEFYDWGKEVTLAAFELIYKKLGTKFDKYYFESATLEAGLATVKDNLGTAKIFQESEGAIVFHAEEHDPKLHTRVFITSQGLPTYETKELGLTMLKFKEENPDISIVTTAVEQLQYMRVVTQALKLLKPELANRMKHITHGMMRFTTGKMSSRKGNVITGESLIADIEAMVTEKIAQRELTPEVKADITSKIAIGAIKYSILKQSPGTDIIFDPETSISFDGNSGPYLQYAHTRTISVLEKARKVGISPSVTVPDIAMTTVEKLLYRFPEIIERATAEYAPSYVVTYLTELAAAFNAYYAQHQIVEAGGEYSAYRVALTAAVEHVLARGLWVLGIAVPDKM